MRHLMLLALPLAMLLGVTINSATLKTPTATAGASHIEEEQAELTELENRLRELRVARRDLLKEVASSMKKRMDRGLVEGDLFYGLMSDLLEAELALEIDPEKRIAIAAANVESLKANESTLETKQKRGVASREDVLKSQAARLQAEIRLAEEHLRQQHKQK